MKRVLSAEQVVSARVTDTGDEVHVVLRDEAGDEVVLQLPATQLGALAAWLDQAAGRIEGDAPPNRPPPPTFPVEWWTVRPEADEEHIVLGFRLAKGMELAMRIHRTAAKTYVQALSSLLAGRRVPAAPSKAHH